MSSISKINISGIIYNITDAYARNMIQIKTTDEWYQINNEVLDKGVILIYSDYKSETDDQGHQIFIPTIKIADGINSVENLPFFLTSAVVEKAAIAEKLEHTLTIGTYSFNGSKDVSIPVYDGSIK